LRCVFFIIEGDTYRLHSYPELAVTFGLILGILFEVRVLRDMLRQQQRMSKSLSVAAGALSDIMEEHFREWKLTSAEQDVATFTIKGFSIAEVAKLRGSAEGTIKTHLNSIYRKVGVPGRAQLVNVLVEDLLNAPLLIAPSQNQPLFQPEKTTA
jgi:DNA-binding NarL/FixJ family response regulator